jgi:hypothetical protein
LRDAVLKKDGLGKEEYAAANQYRHNTSAGNR